MVLPKRQLRGLDWYWVHGHRYGCFAEPDTTQYVGKLTVAWSDQDGVEVEVDAPAWRSDLPDGAALFEGIMIPDDDARKVGLL